MIVSWMISTIAAGVLIAVAATALDHIARVRTGPTRFIWVGAIATALLLPISSTLRLLWPTAAPTMLPFSATLAPLRVVAGATATRIAAPIGDALLLTWVIASSLFLARLAADLITLRRIRRAWPVREVDGRSAHLTTDIGPAVVGFRSMQLVLPEWILSLDESLRMLVLRHEEEHLTARDPHLLIGARLAMALMPWNPALWYAAGRLRLAIELDCDARVLRAHPSPQRYGMLLLAIADRRANSPTALATMLSESTTQLERRILAMRPSRRRLTRTTTFVGAFVAASAIVLACSVQSETAPTAPAPKMNRNPSYFEFQVEKQAAPMPGNAPARYPDALRAAAVEGQVDAQFVVDTTGRVVMSTFKVLKSSDVLFTNSVKSALADMKFYPAEVGSRKVRQLMQMPFVFSLSK
jgi:TonB family protein